MLTKRLLLAFAILVGSAAEAGVTCSGTPCIDGVVGFSSPVTTDPVSATGVWTFNNAANTVATFSDGITSAALSTFTGGATISGQVTLNSLTSFGSTSRGFEAGAFRMEDLGQDNYVTWLAGTDLSASDKTWVFAFGDANRTLTMTGDASLNQSVLTTSSPTFAGIGGAAGKIKMTGTAPALSACGSTTNGTIVGSDAAGRVVMGTQVAALVSCTQTFAVAYSAAPSCVVTPEVATTTTVQALGYTVSASAITYTGTDLDSVAVHYHCTLAQ